MGWGVDDGFEAMKAWNSQGQLYDLVGHNKTFGKK